MSGDLDFVRGWSNNQKEIKEALAEIGFTASTRIFSHPDCKFTIDFTSPPVEVGDVNDPEIRDIGNSIRILTPTECIKDRLIKYFYYKDELALQAAIAVAKSQPFNLGRVESFCTNNKIEKAFVDFKKAITD